MSLPGGNVAANPRGGTVDPPPPGPAPTLRSWPPDLKEITTTVIALVIVGITIWMFYHCFPSAGDFHPAKDQPSFDTDAYTRAKDILGFALGLFGTVTGYYFGRVPAEKQADAARHSADVAKQGQATAEKQTQQLRSDMKMRISGILNSAAPDGNAALMAAAPAVPHSQPSITGQLTSLLAEL